MGSKEEEGEEAHRSLTSLGEMPTHPSQGCRTLESAGTVGDFQV